MDNRLAEHVFEASSDTPSPYGRPMTWTPGTHIHWRYRRGEGHPETTRPVTVVRDDENGLVAWLAPGTPLLRPVLADGRPIREAPLEQRFRLPRRVVRDVWHGQGVLKIAPRGRPWSVWVFWDDDWALRSWYVNLEDVHRRDERGVVTRDHVLDLHVNPDRSVEWKDEDELEAAVAAGRFTEAEAAGLHATARDVAGLVESWEAPFNEGWEHWRPDPGWPVPELAEPEFPAPEPTAPGSTARDPAPAP